MPIGRGRIARVGADSSPAPTDLTPYQMTAEPRRRHRGVPRIARTVKERAKRPPGDPLRVVQVVLALLASLWIARSLWLTTRCADGYLDRLDVRALLIVWVVSIGALLVGAMGDTDGRRLIAMAGSAGLGGTFLSVAPVLALFAVVACARLPRSPQLRIRGLLIAPVSLIVATGLPFMAMSFMHASDFIGRC